MVENVSDLIKLRERMVLLTKQISEDISRESIKNADVLSNAIVSHFIESQKNCLDEEKLMLSLHCSLVIYSNSKKDVLKCFGISGEDFNFLEEHFNLIDDVENLYYGFDAAFLGLNDSNKYYLYIPDLIKELHSRGFDASLKDNKLMIECHISTLDKDVTDFAVSIDKKSVLDVQIARINSINEFRSVIDKIEIQIKEDILKYKSEVIDQIMKILSYKVLDSIDSNDVSFPFKVIRVDFDFINSKYFNKEDEINTDLRFVREEAIRIIERNNLFYVILDVRTFLVDLDNLILELRNKNFVVYWESDDLVNVNADIPSREEILKRKLDM